MSSPEQLPTAETGIETPKVTAEHYERLDSPEKGEKSTIESAEKKVEKARAEALENAVSVEKGGAEKDKKPAHTSPAARRRGVISKKEKAASYKKHMQQVQEELPPLQRAFSKFIHQPAVEKASEVIGATIARPNAILAGSVTAFVLVLGVYLIAKNFGYVLSGFETIAAFIIGWVIGLLYDYFRVMITGKKS